jgi:hypothetical protein
MPTRSSPITLLAWTCILLSALIVAYWAVNFIHPRSLPDPIVPDPASLVARAVTTPQPNPTAIEAITERPLFLPERRSPPDEGAGNIAAVPLGDAFTDVRLVGIAGDVDGGIAIIARGGTSSRVRQGELFEGWTLETLEDRFARFVSGGEVRELHLVYEQQAAAAQGWAAAPPPGVPPIPPGNPAATEEDSLDAQNMAEAIIAAQRARQEAVMQHSDPEP